jgi:hypothetical protein
MGPNSGGGSDRPSRGTPVKRAKWHLGKYYTIEISHHVKAMQPGAFVICCHTSSPM